MIVWTEEEVAVSSLKPYERNPRRIAKEDFEKLKQSIQTLGYHQRIVCQPNKLVIGGHQRIRALKELGIKKVNVLIPDRELTQDEFRQLLIQDNLPFGSFDFEILSADFEAEELLDFGMPIGMIGGFATEKANTPEEEWRGMPEFNQPDAGAFRSMIVHFACAEDMQNFFEIINQTYTDKTKFIWYPEAERADEKNMMYDSDIKQ